MPNILDLPPELRNEIYKLIICDEPTWSLIVAEEDELRKSVATYQPRPRGRRPAEAYCAVYGQRLNILCPMAYMCRQVHAEMAPMVAVLRPLALLARASSEWDRERSKEADKSNLRLRFLTADGKSVMTKVTYVMLPAYHQLFLMFDRWPFSRVLKQKLVAAMRAYVLEKGTGLIAGDVDLDRLAAVELNDGPTMGWSFSIHMGAIECVRHIPGLRQG